MKYGDGRKDHVMYEGVLEVDPDSLIITTLSESQEDEAKARKEISRGTLKIGIVG